MYEMICSVQSRIQILKRCFPWSMFEQTLWHWAKAQHRSGSLNATIFISLKLHSVSNLQSFTRCSVVWVDFRWVWYHKHDSTTMISPDYVLISTQNEHSTAHTHTKRINRFNTTTFCILLTQIFSVWANTWMSLNAKFTCCFCIYVIITVGHIHHDAIDKIRQFHLIW